METPRIGSPQESSQEPSTVVPTGEDFAPLLGIGALRPYLTLLRGQEPDLLLTVVLMLASTAVTLAIPLYAGRFVDAMGGSTDATAVAQNFQRQHLWILSGLLLAQMVGNFFAQVVAARLGLRTSVRLRHRVFAHLLELPALYFGDKKAGDISSRVTSDVGGIQYMLTVGIFSLARALITLIGAIVLMVRLNPRLSTAVLVLIPATILLVRLFGTRLQGLSRRMYDELGRISSHVQETVASIRTLKVYNAQNHECGRFDEMIDNYRQAGLRRAWLSAAFGSASQMSLWICLLAVVIYGFTLVARGQTSGGSLVAFLLLAFRVAVPLGSLTSLYESAQGSIAAAGRLNDILALPTEREPGTAIPEPGHDPVEITLEDVEFAYPGDEEPRTILHGVDLRIEAGRWVGVVGPSGAGKTTLAGLLLGLLPPTRGRLLLDGVPYADQDPTELRSRMAWVAQDPVLYDASLADNIRFGWSAPSDQDVAEAARQAGVMDFADDLPEGLQTICGERGGRLSGGQRQRVALARAFLRNPGLLVLDEPTSALDAASEESIRRSMRRLMKDRTAIVIAHRFSLVKDLDLILVLAEGRIVQQGSHAELMAVDGLYRNLYELQQGEEAARGH